MEQEQLVYNPDEIVILNKTADYLAVKNPIAYKASEVSEMVRRFPHIENLNNIHRERVEKVKDLLYQALSEYHDNDYSDIQSLIKDIASVLGIELSREYEITVDVTYTIQVTTEFDVTPDDIDEDNFYYEISEALGCNFDSISSDVKVDNFYIQEIK